MIALFWSSFSRSFLVFQRLHKANLNSPFKSIRISSKFVIWHWQICSQSDFWQMKGVRNRILTKNQCLNLKFFVFYCFEMGEIWILDSFKSQSFFFSRFWHHKNELIWMFLGLFRFKNLCLELDLTLLGSSLILSKVTDWQCDFTTVVWGT